LERNVQSAISHPRYAAAGTIAAYIQNYPDMSVVLHEQKPATQLEEWRSGRIDLTISHTPVNDVALTSTLLCCVVMRWAGASTSLYRTAQ
jgi:hypothetical protein